MIKFEPLQTLKFREFRNLILGRLFMVISFRMLSTLLAWWIYILNREPGNPKAAAYAIGIIGLSEVNLDEVSQFGVIAGEDLGDSIYKISKFMEKPKKEDAPSNLVQVGINVITPEVFEILNTIKDKKTGEIRLADAYEIMLQKGIPLYGKKIEGEWLDTGSKLGLIKATLKLGIKNEEIGKNLKTLIKDLAKTI